jgi:hypothetical protein
MSDAEQLATDMWHSLMTGNTCCRGGRPCCPKCKTDCPCECCKHVLVPDIDPVRLCCGQRHSTVKCPDGLVMCCICFSRFPVTELHADESGQLWDICQGCKRDEDHHAQLMTNLPRDCRDE